MALTRGLRQGVRAGCVLSLDPQVLYDLDEPGGGLLVRIILLLGDIRGRCLPQALLKVGKLGGLTPQLVFRGRSIVVSSADEAPASGRSAAGLELQNAVAARTPRKPAASLLGQNDASMRCTVTHGVIAVGRAC